LETRLRFGAGLVDRLEKSVLSRPELLDEWMENGIKTNPAFKGLRALVIGGSFAGLTSAKVLAEMGFEVEVFERCKDHRMGGAGIGFDDIARSCLEALGYGKKISVGAGPMPRQVYVTNNGEIFRCEYPYSSCYWNDIYSILREGLPEGVKVHYDRNVVDLKPGEKPTVFFKTRSSEDVQELTFDLVVGADGSKSTVRSILHPGSDLIYRGYSAWRGWLDKSLIPGPVKCALYDLYPDLGNGAIYFHLKCPDAGHLCLYELPRSEAGGGKKVNWMWYLPRDGPISADGTRITLQATESDVKTMRADARKHFPKAVCDFVDLLDKPFLNDMFDMDPLSAKKPVGAARVTLVGDSSHAVTPHMGKGSNMAIADALELAMCLESVNSAEEITPALRKYEEFRRKVTDATLLASRRLGRFRQSLNGFDGLERVPTSTKSWDALSTDGFTKLAGDGRVFFDESGKQRVMLDALEEQASTVAKVAGVDCNSLRGAKLSFESLTALHKSIMLTLAKNGSAKQQTPELEAESRRVWTNLIKNVHPKPTGYLTAHVLDTTEGIPAAGMRITLYRILGRGKDAKSELLGEFKTNVDGRLACGRALEGADFTPGTYEWWFEVGEYYKKRAVRGLAARNFLDQVPIRFAIDSPEAHYHVPLLVSPWSYSTYRGS